MATKMYEINWHSVGDKFSYCTVTAIVITREGVLTGCTGVTIDATDHKGRKFQGSSADYWNTEAEAWADVKSYLIKVINANELSIANLAKETELLRDYLSTVSDKGI